MTKFFAAAVALAVVAIAVAALAGDNWFASDVAYIAGAAAVLLFVLGLAQMTSAKKPTN